MAIMTKKNRKTNLSIYIRGDAAAGAELVGSVASFDECDDKKNRKTFNFLLLTNTFISEVMLQLERGWLKAASFDNFSKAMKRQILYFLHLTNT